MGWNMRRFFLLLLFVLSWHVSASAATFTSKATGDWSASGQTTWNEVGVPGNGDTVVISHSVAVSDDRIVGTSPAASASPTTWDLDIASTGKLTITGAGKLTLRGYGRQRTATTGDLVAVELLDGAIFEFDSSLAPTPATDGYDFYGGTTIWNYRRWQGRGAFTIRSVESAANGRLRGTSSDVQGFLCDFDGDGKQFLLQRLGRSSSLPGIAIGGGTSNANYKHVFIDGVGDGIWGIHAYSIYGGTGSFGTNHDIRFKRYTTINTPAGLEYDVSLTSAAGSSVDRHIDDCAFEKGYWAQGKDVDVRDTSFLGDTLISSVLHKSWDRNLILTSGSTQPAATMLAEYRVAKRTAVNVKLLGVASLGIVTNNDSVFEALHTGVDDGEYITTSSGTVGTNTLNNPIFIPQHDGLGLRWVEWNTDTNVRVVINQATGGANSNSLGFGHSGDNGVTTDRGELRNSIVADFTNGGGGKKIGWISNDVADGVLPAKALKNCGYRLSASRYPSAGGTGYALKQSDISAVMGSGDVDVDPWPNLSNDMATRREQIRRLESWGRVALGLTGTTSEVEDKALRAIHVRHIPAHPEYISGASIPNLYSWVRSGWAATNATLKTAGEGGTYIGAVDVASLGASSALLMVQ